MASHIEPVSDLLRSWGRGNLQARDDLLPLVYRELNAGRLPICGASVATTRYSPPPSFTRLYLRLIGQDRVAWQNRAHFFGIAAQMMRRILIDHARAHQAAKRPGAGLSVVLDDRVGASPPMEVLLLDQALDELARVDARQAQIVELRYFGGLSEQEVATVLALSRATVTREWQTARAWLYRRMTTRQVRSV